MNLESGGLIREAKQRFARRIPKRRLGTTGGGTPLLGSCGGGSFRSGMQSPTGALGGLSSTSEEFVDDGEKASDNGDEQSNKTAEN